MTPEVKTKNILMGFIKFHTMTMVFCRCIELPDFFYFSKIVDLKASSSPYLKKWLFPDEDY